MKIAAPLIHGDFEPAVVTFEVAVVQLVMIGSEWQYQFAANGYSLVAGMGGSCGQAVVLQMKNNQQRTRRHDKVDSYGTEIDQVLDRVHRHTKPGTDVGVAMMQ